MASQFDVQPGFDPTPFTQISAAQLLQMVAQLKPLSNIGGVIYSTTPPTQTEVEVDNPRWIRYILVHFTGSGAPIIKTYNQTTHVWDSVSVGAGSISNSQINGFAVAILSNLTRQADDSTDVSKAKFILRLDSNGQHVEITSIDQILDEEKIEIDQHHLVGVPDDRFIVKRAGASTWGTISPSLDFAANTIPLSKLVQSGNNQIMATDGAGVLQLMSIASAIIANSIRLDRLSNSYDDTVPIDGQVPTHRAAGKRWETPKISNEFIFSLTNTEQVQGTATAGKLPAAGNSAVWQVAHGLGALPKYANVRLVCTTTDGNFAVGDEIDISGTARFNTGTGEYRECFMLKVTSTVIRLNINNGETAIRTWDPNGGATTEHTLTPSSWGVKIIAHN